MPVEKRLMTKPRTVLLPASICRPLAFAPALVPFNSMIGFPAKPGCVVPSMMTGSVIAGRGEGGRIVCAPAPILKLIVSVPTVLLAVMIASRSEPGVGFALLPLSAVVVTMIGDEA